MIRCKSIGRWFSHNGVLPMLLISFCLGASSCTESATMKPAATVVGVKRTEVEEGLHKIEANRTLPETERNKAVDLYQGALKELAAAASSQEKADQYETMRQTAEPELKAVREELAAPLPPATYDINTETLASLKEHHLAAKLEAAENREKRTALEKEINRRALRQREVPLQLESARKRMSQLETPAPARTTRESPEVSDARRIARQVRLQATGDEIQALGRELPAYEAQDDLLLAKKELLERKNKVISRRLEALSNAIDKKEAQQAVAVIADAKKAAQDVNPVLASLAQGNVSLAERLAGDQGVSARLRRLNDTIQAVETELTEIQKRDEALREQEKIIGLTEAMGVLLLRYRADLPDPGYWRKQLEANHPRVDKVQLNLLGLEDQETELSDVPTQARVMARELGAKLSYEKQQELSDQTVKLLDTRRRLLKTLIDDTKEYFQRLLVLEEFLTRLRRETNTLRDYIEERILWTRSGSLLGFSSGPSIREDVEGITDPEHWQEVGRVLHKDIRTNPVGYGFLAAIVVALLAAHRLFLRGIDNTRRPNIAAPGTKGMFRQTILALILTLLLAAPLPLVLWVLSWRLEIATTDSPFPAAVGSAMYVTGVVLAVLCVLLNLCRRQGLAEVHFHWSPETNSILRHYLRIFSVLIVPLVFLVVLANNQSQIVAVSSLGRLLLILSLAIVAVFCAVSFRPNGSLGRRWYRSREGLLFRLRYIWFGLTVLMPVALIVLAFVGYYSLALRLTWEMTITSWFIVALLLLNGLLLRWLTLIFYTVTTRRYRHGKAAKEDSEMDVDISTLREQSRGVLRFVMGVVLILGLWIIWADSLPTLRLLGRVELWNTIKTVNVETVNKDGKTIPQTEEQIEPVTAGDAAVAVLVLILTFAASRSTAGLLRVLILRRLTLDNGAKYAITVLVRYTIGVVGVVVAMSLLGLRWGSIQWLVAAMTVGLGFGLQEIFANFVSGLIILFERPIRIGDTVTVGDTVGTVSKLRIRATTITDWDCKELIVPNREFISSRLVNWTLSDKILRVILRVGIAYGSDTELAERLLREVAGSHSLILKSPPPVVLFSEFGDNSLDFELRVYIRGIEHYMKVWHEMNMAIDKAFRENDITIAFPQRDTHLDTTSPLDIRILPAEGNPNQ